MRRLPVLALLALALPAAGCGGGVEPIRDTAAPAITAPGTTIPYETGGADGSGADGVEKADGRGGIAAGHDTPAPGDRKGADSEIGPPATAEQK